MAITGHLYNRRALDTNSSIPLVNSLNNLTYLTSNSAKIRDLVSTDGALERLVNILHECYEDVYTMRTCALSYEGDRTNRRINMLNYSKERALLGWRWTLAFQCIVLTGTRGTEEIRKRVVMSGVLPILATILDNYLILHKNYDYQKDANIGFDFRSLDTDKPGYNGDNYDYLLGPRNRITSKAENIMHELMYPCSQKFPDFGAVWERYERLKNSGAINCNFEIGSTHEGRISLSDINENSFKFNENEINIRFPREFYLGKIVPKQDDVIWSLQLLAFISKYTYMKDKLQAIKLVPSLSFRYIMEREITRLTIAKNNSTHIPFSSLKEFNPGNRHRSTFRLSKNCSNHLTDKNLLETDPLYLELLDIAHKSKELAYTRYLSPKDLEVKNRYSPKANLLNDDLLPEVHNKTREILERELHNAMEQEYSFDGDEWYQVADNISDLTVSQQSDSINCFPLVEKFTVTLGNSHDIIYWSSVIMRNSCRKSEVTGVRQCANFACGKWEEYPRQFAKCRRCKRTKYCSRDCQLKSWAYHRYWCTEIKSSSKGGNMDPKESSNLDSNGNSTRTVPSTAGTLAAPLTTNTIDQTNTSDNTVNTTRDIANFMVLQDSDVTDQEQQINIANTMASDEN